MSAPPQTLCGVVVSAGKMMRAVKVRTAKQVYNSFLKKHFLQHRTHLVSDPTSALRTGDVVKIVNEKRISRHIYHVVDQIVAPWGSGIEERPRVLSREERESVYLEKRARKEGRREVRRKLERGEGEALTEGAERIEEGGRDGGGREAR